MKKYFSFKGKLNRGEFFSVILLICLISFSLVLSYNDALIDWDDVQYPGYLLYGWSAMQSAKRLRDAGWNPNWAYLMVLPPFYSILIIILFFVPSRNS